jgi:hypothetical protein
MAKVKIQGHASGTGILTVTAPNTSSDRTITLPDETATLSTFDPDGAVTINDTGADVDFRVEGSGEANALFVQGSDGNVGIGTDSPDFQLEVEVDTDSYSKMLSIKNTHATGIPLIAIGDNMGVDDGCAILGYDNSNNVAWLGVNGASIGTGLHVKKNGNVMIGTTSAFAGGLSIAPGNAEVARFYRGGSTGSHHIVGFESDYSSTQNEVANVKVNGDFQSDTNSYGSTSDERIKQDITDATSQWDDIAQLRFVNFRKKNHVVGLGVDAPVHLGLIAQEVEEISPKLITETAPTAWEMENCGFGTLVDAIEAVDEVRWTEDDELPEGVEIGDIRINAVEAQEETWVVKQDDDGKDMAVKSMKYSILYMKAIKALQEAMDRIETLEAKVTALEIE